MEGAVFGAASGTAISSRKPLICEIDGVDRAITRLGLAVDLAVERSQVNRDPAAAQLKQVGNIKMR